MIDTNRNTTYKNKEWTWMGNCKSQQHKETEIYSQLLTACSEPITTNEKSMNHLRLHYQSEYIQHPM